MMSFVLKRVQADRVHPDAPRTSEANTQAEFYYQARLAGWPVILEVRTPIGRLDIAVLTRDKSAVIAIVECKRCGRRIYGDSKQVKRYKNIGAPVYGLNNPDNAARLLATILKNHSASSGVTWAQIAAIDPALRFRYPRAA